MPIVTLSEPMAADLAIYRGDSGAFVIGVADDNDDPIDVSSGAWLGQIKAKRDDSAAITEFDFTPDPDDTSQVFVSITAEHAALLNKEAQYDIQLTLGGKISTLMSGAVLVTKDVSR